MQNPKNTKTVLKKKNRIGILTLSDLKTIFWPGHMACGILVPQPGIKSALNHWTARGIPFKTFFKL